MSNNLIPDGEEIWVRRDTQERAGLLIKRELFAVFHTALVVIAYPLTFYFMHSLVEEMLRLSLGVKYPFIAMLVSLGVPILLLLPSLRRVYPHWLKSITRSRFCPSWLYAEQLNPERLTIYHLRQPPTVIDLKGSRITCIYNRISTTIMIADEQGEHSAILIALLPNEVDRFMRYWNAANSPS